jgi:hypothetical protein
MPYLLAPVGLAAAYLWWRTRSQLPAKSAGVAVSAGTPQARLTLGGFAGEDPGGGAGEDVGPLGTLMGSRPDVAGLPPVSSRSYSGSSTTQTALPASAVTGPGPNVQTQRAAQQAAVGGRQAAGVPSGYHIDYQGSIVPNIGNRRVMSVPTGYHLNKSGEVVVNKGRRVR